MTTPVALSSMVIEHGEREEAFHDCYVALYPQVAKYLYSLTRDADVAHDLAQETFARLFDRWRVVQDPTPYAYRVATNLVRRGWRQRQLDAEVLRHAMQAERMNVALDPTSSVDLREAIGNLPKRHQQLVLLHYYADLPLPTIADVLSRPLGTVKRQLSEARELLAAALEGAR